MTALFTGDNIAAAALVAVSLLAVLGICRTEPGAGLRSPLTVWAVRTVRGLRYHRTGGRHARRADTTPASPLTTRPDIAEFVRAA
jgi:hypothetical protein